MADKLDAIIKLLSTSEDIVDLAWGGAPNERRLQNWPSPGRTRIVVPYRGRGGNVVVAAGVYTDIVPHNPGRGGLSLINIGSNPANCYLVSAKEATALNGGGVPQGYLFASGGTFDGKMTNELYAGPISVYSAAGTTIVWGEI